MLCSDSLLFLFPCLEDFLIRLTVWFRRLWSSLKYESKSDCSLSFNRIGRALFILVSSACSTSSVTDFYFSVSVWDSLKNDLLNSFSFEAIVFPNGKATRSSTALKSILVSFRGKTIYAKLNSSSSSCPMLLISKITGCDNESIDFWFRLRPDSLSLYFLILKNCQKANYLHVLHVCLSLNFILLNYLSFKLFTLCASLEYSHEN